jgi:hypothetical protein
MKIDASPGYAQRNFWSAMRVFATAVLVTCSGCSHLASGPTFYEPVTGVDKNGNPVTRMEKVLALDADISGATIEVRTPSSSLVITSPANGGAVAQRLVLNKKGDAVLGTETTPALATINTSSVVAVKGQATKGVISGIFNGLATAFASYFAGQTAVSATGAAIPTQ